MANPSSTPTPARYSAPAQLLHWLTAILVLVAFIYGPGGPEERVYAASRDAERHLHETLGACVFALSVLRVLWRAVDTRPAPEPSARWMRIVAASVQGGLYLLLFAVPLTAICGAWFGGHDVALLGGITFHSPWAESHALGETLAEVHGWLGDAILWLAGAHAAAALLHHFVLKDGVLRSMLPFGGR
jgi:cytochrome b561